MSLKGAANYFSNKFMIWRLLLMEVRHGKNLCMRKLSFKDSNRCCDEHWRNWRSSLGCFDHPSWRRWLAYFVFCGFLYRQKNSWGFENSLKRRNWWISSFVKKDQVLQTKNLHYLLKFQKKGNKVKSIFSLEGFSKEMKISVCFWKMKLKNWITKTRKAVERRRKL